MFIQTETTPNESSLKFIPGVPVMSNSNRGGTYEILDLKTALPSTLGTRLMGIEGVKSVFFGPDFITVSKVDDDSSNAVPWHLMKPEIFSILMEHFTSGAPLFKDSGDGASDSGPADTMILDTDSEVIAMIKELLDTRVRPAIQEDGGDIEYKGFDEDQGIVRLKLKGSCRGCSSSSVTLKSGIERMLTHYIPEVKAVEQVSGAVVLDGPVDLDPY
jgi:NFU1 iron-sulfur cluster scaffold homolog, mitochondrial